MLVDSHCHLNYLEDPDDSILRATRSGITSMLCVCVNEETAKDVIELSKRYENVYASLGSHPESAGEDLSWLQESRDCTQAIAIGEMGLDYKSKRLEDVRHTQLQSFEYQMALAGDLSKPVIIHTREAEDDTIAVLKNFPGSRGVLHCFTESTRLAEYALSRGFSISFSGIVTFPNAENVREVASIVPRDRLLIETDAPWLSPVPFRGKTNEPSFLLETAKFLASHLKMDFEELCAVTSRNFFDLFKPGEKGEQY